MDIGSTARTERLARQARCRTRRLLPILRYPVFPITLHHVPVTRNEGWLSQLLRLLRLQPASSPLPRPEAVRPVIAFRFRPILTSRKLLPILESSASLAMF